MIQVSYNGEEIDFEEAAAQMDPGLREIVLAELGEGSEQELIDAYASPISRSTARISTCREPAVPCRSSRRAFPDALCHLLSPARINRMDMPQEVPMLTT